MLVDIQKRALVNVGEKESRTISNRTIRDPCKESYLFVNPFTRSTAEDKSPFLLYLLDYTAK